MVAILNNFYIMENELQNEKCISDIQEIIQSVFNRRPFHEQPEYIVHIGCGDGKLLEHIYEIVRDNSLRGHVLDNFPLKLIGVASKERFSVEAKSILNDVNHTVIKGDIANFEKISEDLKKIGVTKSEKILFVCSFYDIDGLDKKDNSPEDALTVNDDLPEIRERTVQELKKRFETLAQLVGGNSLIALAKHSVEADDFLMAAAGVGLIPNRKFFKKYSSKHNLVTLSLFEKSDYKIRYAQADDIPALILLENSCWEKGLRATATAIRKRIQRYPQGQLVLETDNRVAGVIYSQRIHNMDEVKAATMKNVEKLHSNDGKLVQLLAINVFPEMQNRNLGDQLLELMLQKYSVTHKIDTVIGVTRCKDYHKNFHVPAEEYIKTRNKHGKMLDTILRFHEMHGAQIREVIPQYRPSDKKNKGFGVLVEYDLSMRKIKTVQLDAGNPQKTTENKKEASVRDFIVKTIRTILGEAESGFSLERPLMEMGLDSGDLLELTEQISYRYQIPIEATFFFKYNTAERVITYLIENVCISEAKETEIYDTAVQGHNRNNDYQTNEHEFDPVPVQDRDIAIIGISCRLPGGVLNKDQFWELLVNKKDAVSRVPSDRWKWPDSVDPRGDHKGIDCGGFLDDIAGFDAFFFRITPKEAEYIDPQQRLLLELSWECIEDAGYGAGVLSGTKMGVFIGASGSDYGRLIERHPGNISAQYGTGTSMAVLPNRISYFYNFNGPSILIDTACSSSLVAVHEAVKSLQTGECKQALAAGVNIMCCPSLSIAYYKAGMLSKDGKCKTFDKDANGYVRGEGAVMMLLKPLKQALEDKDNVYAVIKGSSINHGGLAGGLTVPNPDKQADLLVEAFKTGGFEPETVSYIEVHGTGTALGDPIEVSGLKEAFSSLSGEKEEKPYCGLGSIKTNIGHLEAAAGMAGLLKVVLSMQNKKIPASLNFKELNPRINFTNTPFYVVHENQEWKLTGKQSLRRAGISSFGSGGTNAHVVLEEVPALKKCSFRDFPYYMICLSAKTEEALKNKERDLSLWLRKNGGENNLTDISATLLSGREHFSVRSAYVVSNINELSERLKEVGENGHATGYFKEDCRNGKEGMDSNCLKAGQAVLENLYTGTKLAEPEYLNKLMTLADLYVKGYNLNWKAIYGDSGVTRISLPTYPFIREHYWIPEDECSDGTMASKSETVGDLLFESTSVEKERKAYFLKKQWEECPAFQIRKKPRKTGILSTLETQALAELISAQVPNSQIILIEDLKSNPGQMPLVWEEYDCCIDLAGCGLNETGLAGWIIWLEQLIEYGQRSGLTLLCVTRGLESYFNNDINMSGAVRAGLYRMLQNEYSYLNSRHMDVEYNIDEETLVRQIVMELTVDSEDAEVCYRKGIRYRAKLQESYKSAGDVDKIVFPDGQVLLITGGTRGLGYLCARHFVRNYGVRRLVLTGQEQLPPRNEWDFYRTKNTSMAQKIKNLLELEAQGAEVQVLSISLTDERAVLKSLREIKSTMGVVGGVIHCAGFSDQENPAFIRKNPGDMEKVFNPKVKGLEVLYKCLENEPLQFFILFSSVSAIIPSLAAGRSDYAMANAYMDYFAEANCRNFPIVSIQWPSWKECGMGEVRNKAYTQTGLLSITDLEGLQLLDLILSQKKGPVVLPAIVSSELWNPEELLRRKKNNFSLEDVSEKQAVLLSTGSSESIIQPVEEWLLELFSKELKMDRSRFDKNICFQDYGIDSILLAQILQHVNRLISEELDPSILLENTTIALFSKWLAENYASSVSKALGIDKMQCKDSDVGKATSSLSSELSYKFDFGKEEYAGFHNTCGNKPMDIAVIGLSCRFPGANTIEEYWSLLSEGRTAISKVKEDRWGYANDFYAGLLDDITHFDTSYFLIPDEDAGVMDPQALLLLEESLKLWYHAGYSREEIKGRRVGVYIGARSRYKTNEAGIFNARNPILAIGQNYLSANISRFFDLRGPSLVIDTACSSALVGMNMSIQALQLGEIDFALVGGVSLLDTDIYHKVFKQRNILSKDSSFHIFDQRAQGVVLGEGAGVVLLKTLERAISDGDNIHAVIKAVSVNNDGRTAGPAAPNIQAQKEVMQDALQKGCVKPEKVSYIEVNGSGSEVTDLLELKSIQSVYRSQSNIPLGLGSIKPNIGHPLCAEGIASFIKVVLMLENRQLTPFLSGKEPMTHYNIDSSPFCFYRKATEWKNKPWLAAINCFADGGTNVHMLLEAWNESASYHPERRPIPPPKLTRYNVHHCREVFPEVSERSSLSVNGNIQEPTSKNKVSIWKRKIPEV